MSKQKVSAIVQGASITIIIDGKDYTVNKESADNFHKIKNAVLNSNYKRAVELMDRAGLIEKAGKKHNIAPRNGMIYWKDLPIDPSLHSRLMKLIEGGFDVSYMVKFLENLVQNPSNKSIKALYAFLEKNSLPITDDGHFMAYKKVDAYFRDIYTGAFDNSVGKIVEVPRNKVDDDNEKTCSHGLHVCSKEYLQHYGSGTNNKVVLVKINPKDVVAVPPDYNNAKMRVCRYEVMAYVGPAPENHTFDDVYYTI